MHLAQAQQSHIVVLGAGHGGANVVAMLRQRGYDGRVTLVGEEPAAPYQRPPLSKDYLQGRMTDEQLLIRPAAFYEEQRVECILSRRAERIDPQSKTVTLADDRELTYDAVVLATGSTPRALRVPGAELAGVHYLRNHDHARALGHELMPGRRVVIVGGGYVGLEVAASARKAGCDVVVLEREDRALARVASPELAAFLVDQHAQQGVEVVTGADVVSLSDRGDGHVGGVALADGSTVACDVVLVGIGAVPCDELARSAGLDCRGGVEVDAEARTAQDGIWAVGDMTVRPLHHFPGRHRLESIPSAVEQAKQAVASILGTPAPAPEVPWFWSDQYDFKIKIAGLARGADATVLRGDPLTGRFSVFHLHGGRVVAAETVSSSPDFMLAKRLIDSGRAVDPSRLADCSLTPRELAA